MTYFQAIANELQEAIDRVRELHVPKDHENTCKVCDHGDTDRRVSWPCPTVKALDLDGNT